MINDVPSLPMTNWQTALKQAVKDPVWLLQHLELPLTLLQGSADPQKQFPLRVPLGFIQRMKKGDPKDPLLKQVLPIAEENEAAPGFSKDPLQESLFTPKPGLWHKYHGRVLVMLSAACAIHCRYCFRRHFNYSEYLPGKKGLQAIIETLQQDPEIHEVILSGGDPLTAPDQILSQFAEQLASIPHLKTLRIHSRLPIVLPERINESFLDWFAHNRLKPVMVVHCNHPNEIDDSVKEALFKLKSKGVLLLNQSVLLAGINDHVEVLETLSHALFQNQVLPYYLHLLDPVLGTHHFQVSKEKGVELMRQLSARLPGYLVPKLVQEIPGEESKTSIQSL